MSVPCLRYDSTKSIAERDDIRRIFEEERESDIQYHILLATQKAVNKGLTFNYCAAMYFVEPSWNPATFQQAVGSALRRENPNQVEIFTSVTLESIETRVKLCKTRSASMAICLQVSIVFSA